ncbi:hypothetical protein [Acidithiobacillus marinus]|nr:hypothetical protein [Acidithiobacillus marinus]
MRKKRAKDQQLVLSNGDNALLSDAALIEQLGIAYRNVRRGQSNTVLLGLLQEVAARSALSGVVL